jgi:hypothetical protein
MFQYTVMNSVGQYDILYEDTPLQNCWIQEILVRANRELTTVLPPQFGFFPTAEVRMFEARFTDVKALILCEGPNVTLWTQYTYANTDPLRQAYMGIMSTSDITYQAPSYWAQALLIYWWDQIALNLTQANQNNFNNNLQSVLLQGIIFLPFF